MLSSNSQLLTYLDIEAVDSVEEIKDEAGLSLINLTFKRYVGISD